MRGFLRAVIIFASEAGDTGTRRGVVPVEMLRLEVVASVSCAQAYRQTDQIRSLTAR